MRDSEAAGLAPNLVQPMTAKVIQLRDYKRKEENDAALVRLAKEVMGLIEDTAPSPLDCAPSEYVAPEEDAG